MNIDDRDQADRLAHIWDAIVSGIEPSKPAPDLLAEIRFVEQALAVPPPPASTRDRMWKAAIDASSLGVTPVPLTSSPNGVSHERIPARRSIDMASWAAFWRIIAIGTLAGFGAGFLTGLWARLAMRASGFLTIDRHRALLTEAEARVGDITLVGTLFLAFTGAVMGIMGGLLYIAVRRWLPTSLAVRSTSFGLLLLAVFGFVIMDEHNTDYQLFGPPWVNVTTFSLSYLLYGVLASVFVERMDATLPRLATRSAGSLRQKTVSLLLLPFAAIGSLGLAFALIAGVRDIGAAIVAGIFLISAIASVYSVPRWRIPLPGPAIRWAGTAVLLVPACFGVFLTTQGIVGILTG